MKNKSSDIRKKFIQYFVSKGHTHVGSSPILPANDDKSLLFTNAGMVQFKDYFLGLSKPKFKSAVTSQKCIRAGGKHNDLDNVGFTNRHHTFFEMLGNFSFGDYFKEDAIQYAWDFLTNELNIPADKLWITVHDSDLEAKNIWLENIGINKDRLSIIGTNDNFWSMGDIGPCGPCTEIFYDFGEKYKGFPPGQGDEGERYVEIWNLVFMQFNRISKDKIEKLPHPSVDTGMGLERICAVMQNEHSNYDTDLFTPMISFIKKNVSDKYKNETSSMKVLADHIRSISFLISEKVLPSNEGHGYVLRRIIRRSARHAQKIGFTNESFIKLIPIFIDTLRQQYQEIDNQSKIAQVLEQEIVKFNETLEVGLDILDKNINKLMLNKSKKLLSGELLFLLYDTYGFPVDLTSTIAREKNFEIDIKVFEKLMDKQKENSKKSKKFGFKDEIDFVTKYSSDFTGYIDVKNRANILEIFYENNSIDKIKEGQKACIVIDSCPFYAEAGGQIGDSGKIFSDNGIFEVIDTQKRGSANLLIGEQVKGILSVKDEVVAEIDQLKRENIKLNHSATHLLHSALINNIGDNVQQKGSLVTDTKLRFDFACEKSLDKKTLSVIENDVNQNINKNIPAHTSIMNKDEAIKKGAIALFGEKYDEEVRVLSFGDVSVELCGGTHVNNTGDIGVFKILSESSISSGVRRIEAITGMSANEYLTKRDNLVSDLCQSLNVQDDQLEDKIKSIVEDNKKLKKDNSNLIKKIATFEIINKIQNQNIVYEKNFHIMNQDYIDGKILKNIFEDIKSSAKNLILIILQKNKSKLEIYVLVTQDCFKVINAKEIISYINDSIGSTGGGREDLAQAGLEYQKNIDDLVNTIKENTLSLLKSKVK